MNEPTKRALDWLLTRWPEPNDVIRSYSINMVIFIANMCAEYHAASVSAEEKLDGIR